MNAAPPLAPRPVEVSTRRVIAIALPMALAHLSTPLLGFADLTVIGQFGDAVMLGAVALGTVMFNLIFWAFGFLRMGTTGLTAQAIGAGNALELRACLLRALLMGGVCGFLLIVLHWPLRELVFRAMGASAEVETVARVYFNIRIWSAPLALFNYAVLGWFLGRGEAGTGLLLQIFLNGANIVLNIVFALLLGLGVTGVAIGTVIGEALTVVLGMWLAARALGFSFGVPRAVVLEPGKLIATMAVNRDIMIRSLALLSAFAFFSAQGARLGDTLLAANAVLLNLFLMAGYFMDGIATAAEQICGQATGARNRVAFRRAMWLTLRANFLLAASMTLLLLAASPYIIPFMTSSEEVRALARNFAIYTALAPLCAALAFQMDGVYVGAAWGRAMRNLMLGVLAASFAVWWLLTPLGNHGLWLALLAFLLMRGVAQAIAYPWLERRQFPW